MSPAPEDRSPADWKRLFASPRSLDAPSEESPPVPGPRAIEELRREFQSITLTIRGLNRSPWLNQAAFRSLQKSWQEALALTQLVVQEIQTDNHEPHPESPALLQALRTLLARVQQQNRLGDMAHEVAEALHPLLEEIAYGQQTSLADLRQLADELRQTLVETHDIPALFPLEAIQLHDSLIEAGWPTAESIVQPILCARLLAQATRGEISFDRDQQRRLILAALLQEIGCLVFNRRPENSTVSSGRRSREGRRRADPNHPATGAALLAQISDAGSRLLVLVSEHHERADGTGFPHRWTSNRLGIESQYLALAVRLTEHVTDPVSSELAVEHNDPLSVIAGMRLWREIQRGAFSEQLAIPFLNSLEPGLAQKVATLSPQRQKRLVDVRHQLPGPVGWPEQTPPDDPDRRTAVHSAETTIDPPSYFRRQRESQRRGVFIPTSPSISE